MSEQEKGLVTVDKPAAPATTEAPLSIEPTAAGSLVAMALKQGANLEMIKELLAMQKDEEAYQARKAYTAAMADFKGRCPSVLPKDAQVDFKTSKGRTHYKHASLGGIVDRITPHLSACGLSIAWSTEQEQNRIKVTTTCTHVDGHQEQIVLSGAPDASGQKNSIQQVGSTITYLQRYGVLSLLGLATSENGHDDDGQTAASTPQISDRAAKALQLFKRWGVGRGDLEGPKGCNKPAVHWTDTDLDGLKALAKQWKGLSPIEREAAIAKAFGDGQADPEDADPGEPPPFDPPEGVDEDGNIAGHHRLGD